MKLDKEEKEIMDAYEKGLIKAKHPSEEELKEVKNSWNHLQEKQADHHSPA